MPDASELVSLANLKVFLAITGSGKDTILQAIKDAVEPWVKRYCDRDFLVTSYVEYYDGNDAGRLRLRQRPITAITSIYADPARLWSSNTLIPASDIIIDSPNDVEGIVELYVYRFLMGRKAIKVTYTAGYSTIPGDLQHAVKLICAKQFKVIDKGLIGQTTQTIGDLTITFDQAAIPKDAMDILQRFKGVNL